MGNGILMSKNGKRKMLFKIISLLFYEEEEKLWTNEWCRYKKILDTESKKQEIIQNVYKI